jgi:O6-methylguanine-DNA--protein-cysteine methyltransferase
MNRKRKLLKRDDDIGDDKNGDDNLGDNEVKIDWSSVPDFQKNVYQVCMKIPKGTTIFV